MYYIEMVIEILLDALEDFAESLFIPVGKQLTEIFIYSLIYLLVSIYLGVNNIMCFVSWKEALLTSTLLLIFILCSYRGRFDVLKRKVLKLKGVFQKHEK